MLESVKQFENQLKYAVQIEGQAEENLNLSERMQYYHVPGLSLAWIHQGKIAWSKTYGVKQVGQTDEVTTETLFQAASISKPVMAGGAMALVEQGLIDLDADVNQVLRDWQVPENEFTLKEKVTLRRLLSHNAGLTVHGFGGYAQSQPVPDVIQILNGEEPANSGPVRVDVEPGSIWRYSGGGSTIAQLLISEISGKPFEDVLREQVLEKVGMSRSGYQQPLPIEKHGQEACAHNAKGEAIEGKWHTYPELAAAGLWTTPTDLAKYAIALREAYLGKSDTFLKQETVREMLRHHIEKWGLGPSLGLDADENTVWLGHGGSNEGFRCQMLMYLQSGDGLVVMTNADQGGSLNAEIIRAFAGLCDWPQHKIKVREHVSLRKEELEPFVGVYAFEIDPAMVLSVVLQDGVLLAQAPYFLENQVELHPCEQGKFFIKENGMQIEFSGDVSALEVNIPDVDIHFLAKRMEG